MVFFVFVKVSRLGLFEDFGYLFVDDYVGGYGVVGGYVWYDGVICYVQVVDVVDV